MTSKKNVPVSKTSNAKKTATPAVAPAVKVVKLDPKAQLIAAKIAPNHKLVSKKGVKNDGKDNRWTKELQEVASKSTAKNAQKVLDQWTAKVKAHKDNAGKPGHDRFGNVLGGRDAMWSSVLTAKPMSMREIRIAVMVKFQDSGEHVFKSNYDLFNRLRSANLIVKNDDGLYATL